jgi:hypothetical protein
MTSLLSIFKADHYSAIRQNELIKTMKRDKYTTTFAFRNGESLKQGSTTQRTLRKTSVIIRIIIIIIIIIRIRITPIIIT